MAANSSFRLTATGRLAYAEKLKKYATIEAQHKTDDPVWAVDVIEWMVANYSRPETT